MNRIRFSPRSSSTACGSPPDPWRRVGAYQKGAPEIQQEALSRWHGELGERIPWLTLARKYIEGLKEGRREDVTLQVTPPERVAWFVHDAPSGMFGQHYMRRHRSWRRPASPSTTATLSGSSEDSLAR